MSYKVPGDADIDMLRTTVLNKVTRANIWELPALRLCRRRTSLLA